MFTMKITLLLVVAAFSQLCSAGPEDVSIGLATRLLEAARFCGDTSLEAILNAWVLEGGSVPRQSFRDEIQLNLIVDVNLRNAIQAVCDDDDDDEIIIHVNLAVGNKGEESVAAVKKVLSVAQGMLAAVLKQLADFLVTYLPQIADALVIVIDNILPAIVETLVGLTPPVLQLVSMLIAECPAEVIPIEEGIVVGEEVDGEEVLGEEIDGGEIFGEELDGEEIDGEDDDGEDAILVGSTV